MIRLSDADRAGIEQACERVLGDRPGAVVRLFGSRARAGRGGDIDLLVSLASAEADELTLKIRFKQAVEDRLGERKIDVVVEGPGGGGAFAALAKQEGVILWSHPRKN